MGKSSLYLRKRRVRLPGVGIEEELEAGQE